MLRRVTLVRTDVSEELSASFVRMARIGELGTTLAVLLDSTAIFLRLRFETARTWRARSPYLYAPRNRAAQLYP
jgi:hypothetical protein